MKLLDESELAHTRPGYARVYREALIDYIEARVLYGVAKGAVVGGVALFLIGFIVAATVSWVHPSPFNLGSLLFVVAGPIATWWGSSRFYKDSLGRKRATAEMKVEEAKASVRECNRVILEEQLKSLDS